MPLYLKPLVNTESTRRGIGFPASFCQPFSYSTTGSRDRRKAKQSAIDRDLATAYSYAPNANAGVVGDPISAHSRLEKNSGEQTEKFSTARSTSTRRGPRGRC